MQRFSGQASRGAVLAGALFIGGAALAQDAQPAPADAAQASGVEEIIVTATKRAQNIQDVPIAVTALTDVQLEREGIRDIRDLPSLSPSFNMNSSNTTTGGTTLRIRGIGTTGNNAGLESAVGVFIDGVYLSRPGIALGDLVDVEAVEVLRGPQGTLFGRNTSAGALHIRTKKPDLEEMDAWANASVGNLDFKNIQAGGSIPLVQGKIATRFSAAWRDMDGYMKSTAGVRSHDKDRYSLRGQLLWLVNEDVELRLIGDYAKVNEHCCDAAITYDPEFDDPLSPGIVPGSLFTNSGLNADGGAPAVGHGAVKNQRSNGRLFGENTRSWGLSGEVSWELGEIATLTTLTAYRRFKNANENPSHYTNLDVYNFPSSGSAATNGFGTSGSNSVFSQEVRLQGDLFDSRFEWLVGFFYSDEEIRGTTTGILGADYTPYMDALLWRRAILPALTANAAVFDPFVLPVGAPGLGITTLGDLRAFAAGGGSPSLAFAGGLSQNGEFAANHFEQDGRSWSIFTHNTFHVTDRFSLTAGLRYIDEQKDGRYDQLDASSPACRNIAQNGNALAALSAALGGGIRLTHCFFLTTEVGFAGSTSQEFNGPRFEDDELAYTVSASFAITDEINTYASFSHGFKAGGYNLDTTAALNGADPRFASETVDAYEVGLKTTLFDRTRANVAVFHQEMDDFQVLEFTGTRFETFNVDTVKSTGVEVETSTQVMDPLNVTASITYANSRYPSDCAPASAIINARSLCGNLLTNSPKWSGVVGFTWENDLPVGTGLRYFVGSSIRLESKRRTSTQWRNPSSLAAGNTVRLIDDFQSANEKVNARLGLSGNEGLWTVELWATNLFDKTTKNVTFNTPLRGGSSATSVANVSRGSFVEAPRLYGLTVRLQY